MVARELFRITTRNRRAGVFSEKEAGHGNINLGDWSQCPAVEKCAARRGGAWVFKDTRMPVATVFENLEAGSDIEEIVEQFHVTREQIQAVLKSLPPADLDVAWQVPRGSRRFG